MNEIDLAGSVVTTLTRREIEVLRLMADGARNKGIAAILGLSIKTVEYHKARLYSRIGVDNAAAAVRWAIRAGHL